MGDTKTHSNKSAPKTAVAPSRPAADVATTSAGENTRNVTGEDNSPEDLEKRNTFAVKMDEPGITPGRAGTSSPGNDKEDHRMPIADGTQKPTAEQK